MEMITSIKSGLLILKKKVLSIYPFALVLSNKMKLLKEKKFIILLLLHLFCSRKMLINYIEGNCYLLLLIL